MSKIFSFSLARWFRSGSAASIFSLLVLAWHGRRRHGSSAALINAPSHWIHGDRALRANVPSWRFTPWGALIHHFSALFWAALYEASLQKSSKPSPVFKAGLMAAVAWLLDTRVAPKRLTPGFERRSSSMGLFMVYSTFALGLALGAKLSKGVRDSKGRGRTSPPSHR